MWTFKKIHPETPGNRQAYLRVQQYIREKNLNFIVARGNCINRRQDTLSSGELDGLLREFSACGFCWIAFSGKAPSPPFLAAALDEPQKRARVMFLIDFTREAESGQAGKFYSKIMGAFATRVFAACPEIEELEFPFTLENTVGRGLTLASGDKGRSIIKKDRSGSYARNGHGHGF